MICRPAKAESQGDQPMFTSYPERCPPQRELLGTARCGPGELRGPSLVPLFMGSQDDWHWASVVFHPGHNSHDTILICRQWLYNASTT